MQEMHFPVTKIVLKAGVKTRRANLCKPVEVGLKEHDFYEVCIFPEFFFSKGDHLDTDHLLREFLHLSID